MPIEQEQAGTAYIADCGLSRRDREPVLDYVKQKYRRPRLIEFEPTHYSVETSVEPGRTRDEMAKRQMLSHENWHPIPPCGSTTDMLQKGTVAQCRITLPVGMALDNS